MADPWVLVDFESRLRQWIERDNPTKPQWVGAARWMLDLPSDPFAGAHRDMANLWFRAIPETLDSRSRIACCSYWIDATRRVVRCESFALLTWPVLHGDDDPRDQFDDDEPF